MGQKITSPRLKALLFIISIAVFLGMSPLLFQPGLTEAQPIGAYLNGKFSSGPLGTIPYRPVFPNLTFDSPLTFSEVQGNRIVLGQRDGKIYWFDKNPDVAVKNLMLDLSNEVGIVWDGGFLGMAFHPKFNQGNNYFYVYYTTKAFDGSNGIDTPTSQNCTIERFEGNFIVLARYTADPVTLEVFPSSEQVLFKLRMYNSTHRGGDVLFGDDGFLYIPTGDQAAFAKSQDISTNLDGGVLRIDVDRDPAKSHPPIRKMPNTESDTDEISGQGYWIPNDNPFLSPNGENYEEYFTLGNRNPHRMTKDRLTGKMYIGEIGSNKHEEINVLKKGANYGWPVYEGPLKHNLCMSALLNDMPHEEPLAYWPRAEANSIIGGFVYRGTEVPELYGKYLCADWGNGEEIWSVDITSGAYEQLGSFASTNVISFGEDTQGELYILKQGEANLFRIVSETSFEETFPMLLSETGAFKDLNTLEVADGIVEYDMIESFWSDGALKKRWMAVPNDGNPDTPEEQIKFSENGDWQFPIGSVLIKHFELPLNENDPTDTRRLETRFSIKGESGDFYFLTYKWNDQQTDAYLVSEDGDQETYTVRTENGSTRQQIWDFPSTKDCVTCHNQETGGTLGTRTRYLNKNITYQKTGVNANQLVTLSHIGLLDETITDAQTATYLTFKALDDSNATIDEKSRSYLDLNCAYCHRPGTGNRGEFELSLNLPLFATGLLDASPNESLGIPNESILNAGDPETSILYHRMNSVEPGIAMPPLSKNRIDTRAVSMINDWISQLDEDTSTTRENLALGKPAVQSSTDFAGIASNAVDGNTNGRFGSGSTTHTTNEANAWWRVDLGNTYSIDFIRVYNRTDCCGERLEDAEVYVGDLESTNPEDFTKVGTLDASASNSFSSITRGRYLLIRKSGSGFLSLTEVEVYGTLASPLENIALNKPAVQSSTDWGGVSSRAVDGNRDGNYEQGRSITHTRNEANAWWRVDLGDRYNISQIGVYNRTNCCMDRLDGVEVYVGDTPTAIPSDYDLVGALGAEASYNLDTNTTGRYVFLRKSGSGHLSLAEVEVFGTLVTPQENIALNKPAVQSSTGWGGVPSRAVDGNRDGNYGQGRSITHTRNEANAWWRVDLGDRYDISQIDVYNRTNCCMDRLEGVEVYVGDSPTVTPSDYDLVGALGAEASYNLSVNATGRYVFLRKSVAGYLSLAEVEVYGTLAEELVSQRSTAALKIQAKELEKINIFPNPSEGYFSLDFGSIKGPLHIQVYSMLGQLVYSKNFGENRSKTELIDISYLPTGIYNVIIYSDTSVSEKAIIIAK